MGNSRSKQPGASSPPSTDPISCETIPEAITVFDQLLGSRIITTLSEDLGKNPNLTYSTFSAFRVLSLTLAGAKGETRDGMARALGVSPSALSSLHEELRDLGNRLTRSNTLTITEAVYLKLEHAPDPEFEDLAFKFYNAKVEAVEFPQPGEDIINAYVKEKTHGLIPIIVQDLSDLTRMVLVNTLYFKCDWANQFESDFTNEEHIFRSFVPNAIGTCHMMQQYNVECLGASQEIQFQDHLIRIDSLLLPYSDRRFFMVFLKPHNGHEQNTFASFLSCITSSANSSQLFSLMKPGSSEMHLSKYARVAIPKFRVDSGLELGGALGEMGMQRAFDPDRADFSGLVATEAPHLAISNVVHKCVMIVDESGTECAAVTAVIEEEGEEDGEEEEEELKEFVLDSPFVALVVAREGNGVLFSAVVRDPARGGEDGDPRD